MENTVLFYLIFACNPTPFLGFILLNNINIATPEYGIPEQSYTSALDPLLVEHFAV